MNRKLIELYFEMEKELDTSKEDGKIQDFINHLQEETEKVPSNQLLLKTRLKKFQDEQLMFLITNKNSSAKKSAFPEIEQEFPQLVMNILEKILGDDLVQAKKMLKEKQLGKIVEKYVE